MTPTYASTMATPIDTASGFSLRFEGGRTLYVHTPGAKGYEEALELARSEGAVELGHGGDLADGGDRTLCWSSAEDARDDAPALCAIVGTYEVTP